MTDFLPPEYKIPQAPSGYMRLEEGINRIRVLSSAIVGYEYFNTSNRPVRSKTPFKGTPDDIKAGGKVKPFWAFVVWNYASEAVQILELTQVTIMEAIQALVNNPKWGDPKKYDIAITRNGEGFDTTYQTQAEPPIEDISLDIKAKYLAKPIHLEALFDGEDPFKLDIADNIPL